MNEKLKPEWSAFCKSRYDEWHVGVPCEGGVLKVALCPDGILPGLDMADRERTARFIAASCTACEGLNPEAVAAVAAVAEDALTLIDDMARFVGKVSLQNYALFHEVPMALRSAVAKLRETTVDVHED